MLIVKASKAVFSGFKASNKGLGRQQSCYTRQSESQTIGSNSPCQEQHKPTASTAEAPTKSNTTLLHALLKPVDYSLNTVL